MYERKGPTTLERLNQKSLYELYEAYRTSHVLYKIKNGKIVGTEIEDADYLFWRDYCEKQHL